jgi:membrane glycosyltransferase
VIVGLLLCIPIALLSATVFPESKLLVTPEQTTPPDVLVRANELANDSDHVIVPALVELGHDRDLLENHIANLPDIERRIRGQIDPHLAIARAKIEDAETFEEALSFLTTRETMAVLNSCTALSAVFDKPRA